MSRYIDAEPLEKKFAALYDKAYRIGAHPHIIADRMGYLQDIQLAPTEDVVPVRHGKWLESYSSDSNCPADFAFYSGFQTAKCSACNITQSVDTYQHRAKFKYCPYCGAKMDERIEG